MLCRKKKVANIISEHKISLTGRWTAKKYLKLPYTQTHYETEYTLVTSSISLGTRRRKVVLAFQLKKRKIQNVDGLLFDKVILPEKCLFFRITRTANTSVCTQGLVTILILHIYIIVDMNIVIYPLNREWCFLQRKLVKSHHIIYHESL